MQTRSDTQEIDLCALYYLNKPFLFYIMTTAFGWIASIISLVYKLPQIYLLYRNKKHESISLLSICIQAVSYVFYTVHGIYINDDPIFYMGIVCLAQSFCLIFMYFVYRKASQSVSESELTTVDT